MSESDSKTITDYEKDAFEDEPIEEYVEEVGTSDGTDNLSEISEEPHLKGSLDDITTSTADLEISSNTPSDFNSEDHAFHLNFIHESASKIPLLKRGTKAGNRYNLSFSNDRMREIERHNRILLGKILSKGQSCIPMVNQRYRANNVPPPPTRVSSAAINRKKQQRQIDLDNQVLKRKIEEIASRRPKKNFN